MLWPRAGSSVRVKRARQEVCLGSETRKGETRNIANITGIGARTGREGCGSFVVAIACGKQRRR